MDLKTVSDDVLGAALRTILAMNLGVDVGFFGMLEIGQLENLNYYVRSSDGTKQLWFIDDIGLDEAIEHFLRLRHERQFGFDIEHDLMIQAGSIKSPAKPGEK